jgi:hypothetical protein
MTVERVRGNRIISIGQQQYVLDMLERFNMMDCKPLGSPMAVDALSNFVETSTSIASISWLMFEIHARLRLCCGVHGDLDALVFESGE